MSDDEADAAGAAEADAYAKEFAEDDDDYEMPSKKMKSGDTTSSGGVAKAWCLVVKLKFEEESGVAKLREIFEPYAAWIKENEPTTLAYELLLSDKDPLVVTIFERYSSKDEGYIKIHRASAEFARFRPKLAALKPVIDGESYFESPGSGFYR